MDIAKDSGAYRLPIVRYLMELKQIYRETYPIQDRPYQIEDPVIDFMDILNLGLAQGQEDYISEQFTRVKGTTEVLELMKSALDIDMTYIYNSIDLEIVIKSLVSSSPNSFEKKLFDFLSALLYFFNYKIDILEVILLIESFLGVLTSKVTMITYSEFTFNTTDTANPVCLMDKDISVTYGTSKDIDLSKSDYIGKSALFIRPEDYTYTFVGGTNIVGVLSNKGKLTTNSTVAKGTYVANYTVSIPGYGSTSGIINLTVK